MPPHTDPAPLPATSSALDLSRWFTEEVQPHDAQLKAYLRGSFPAVRDVDDVVQESFLRIWKARAQRPIGATKAFLFAVARHLALDTVRRDRRCAVETVGDMADLDVIDEQASVAESVSRAERITLLIQAIDSLPPRCREVMILRKLKFLPQREVAQRLGISESGVEIQLTRGIARCRDFLRRRGVDTLFNHEA